MKILILLILLFNLSGCLLDEVTYCKLQCNDIVDSCCRQTGKGNCDPKGQYCQKETHKRHECIKDCEKE